MSLPGLLRGLGETVGAAGRRAGKIILRVSATRLESQDKELEELRAELADATFWELADGVAVTPALVCQDVWTWVLPRLPVQPVCITILAIRFMEYDAEFDGKDPWGDEQTVAVEDCYSSRQAAVKEKEERATDTHGSSTDEGSG